MRKLFVIMPFGRKRSAPAEEEIDFDRVYSRLIQSSAVAAGLQPMRSDEMAEPGRITDQFLRELFHADAVLADVTLPNENVPGTRAAQHAARRGRRFRPAGVERNRGHARSGIDHDADLEPAGMIRRAAPARAAWPGPLRLHQRAGRSGCPVRRPL